MALKKLKVVREYEADYWKIIQINAGYEGTAEVTFGLFKNRAASVLQPALRTAIRTRGPWL